MLSFLNASRTSSHRAFRATPQMRKLATATPPTKSKGSLPLMFAAGGAVLVGGFFLSRNDQPPAKSESSTVTNSTKGNQESSPFDPKEWRKFKLVKVEPYNHNTAKFTFELPDDQASLLPVASLVMIQAANPDDLKDKDGKPIARPYTPISSPDEQGKFVLMIKKYDDGNASKYVHGLSVGEELAIKGPFKKYGYKQNEFEEVGLIGGGSGITPLYQVLTHALADPSNKTKFKLIFSNVTEKDILLREEFDALAQKYPDTFKPIYVVDKPSDDWKGASGYITKELVQENLLPASAGGKVKIFVCGPPPQMKAISGDKENGKQGEVGGILKELGYTTDQVYKF